MERLGIGQNVGLFEPLGVNEDFRDVALDGSKRYEELYLTGLYRSHYNFILEDFSYLQFSCERDDEVRYAYLPNPFLSTESGFQLSEMRELVDEGSVSLEEYLHHISEMRSGQHPPPIRYENSIQQYVEFQHPTSHFHFGHHGDNRWPASKLLTPTAFSAMIAKQFYGAAWSDARHRDVLTGVNALEEMLSNEKARCARIGAGGFSDGERTQFFFD